MSPWVGGSKVYNKAGSASQRKELDSKQRSPNHVHTNYIIICHLQSLQKNNTVLTSYFFASAPLSRLLPWVSALTFLSDGVVR